MILIGKIGDMWRYVDLETKKIMVSHDVVFDEVSSCQIKGKIDLAPFYEDVASSERGSNIYSCQENIQQDEISDGVTQRSSRQRKLPYYLTYYEIQLNQSSLFSCFFIGDACESEPKFYNKAKGFLSGKK